MSILVKMVNYFILNKRLYFSRKIFCKFFNIMKTQILFLPVVLITLYSCEENKNNLKDTNTSPPSIFIVSPTNNSTVNDTVFINCESNDDDGIERVELWI